MRTTFLFFVLLGAIAQANETTILLQSVDGDQVLVNRAQVFQALDNDLAVRGFRGESVSRYGSTSVVKKPQMLIDGRWIRVGRLQNPSANKAVWAGNVCEAMKLGSESNVKFSRQDIRSSAPWGSATGETEVVRLDDQGKFHSLLSKGQVFGPYASQWLQLVDDLTCTQP